MEEGFEKVSKISDIWNHWHYNKSAGSAKCIYCHKVLVAKKGNATGLKKHSLSEHNIAVEKVDREILPPAKKSRIDKYFLPKKMSIETKVSRLCSLTCLSFRVLATDVDIRASLKAEGYDLPLGNSNIQKLVYKKYGKL